MVVVKSIVPQSFYDGINKGEYNKNEWDIATIPRYFLELRLHNVVTSCGNQIKKNNFIKNKVLLQKDG